MMKSYLGRVSRAFLAERRQIILPSTQETNKGSDAPSFFLSSVASRAMPIALDHSGE
jgi:hypothetical protein